MAINQIESSKLEQRYVIKFLVVKKCKLCEIYSEKHVLVKKMFTNWLNISLLLQAKIKK